MISIVVIHLVYKLAQFQFHIFEGYKIYCFYLF